MASLAIQANGLNRWFGEGDARTHAVKDVTFDARFGEMLYVEGPSGSGKTTLLSMISGILRPTSGEVMVEGRDIWGLSPDELAEFRLNKIGFVFQDYHLFPRLSTLENAAMSLVMKRMDWGQAMDQAMHYREGVGLKDRAALPPVKLSGGEQQRVAIARAIAGRPDLLVFDEPTASLDGDTGRRIVEFVKKEILTAEKCIILVTHDSRIFEYADRIMRMEDGKVKGFEKGQAREE
jgi:putative ABC transport system ATP-binding protein